MTLKEKVKCFVDVGFPAATFAKRIGYDPSTIHKWLYNDRNGSVAFETAVLEGMRYIRDELNKIDLD